MIQAECPITTPVSEADIAAITSLFKRIAERGHRIRTQSESQNTDTIKESATNQENDSNHPIGNPS
jgi:hypothetical protein